MIIGQSDTIQKRLKVFLGKEMHIKAEEDENPVLYVLKEVGRNFITVDYGESQRLIPIHKIIFVQIGNYPKEVL